MKKNENVQKAIWVKPDTFRKIRIALAKNGMKTDTFIKSLLEKGMIILLLLPFLNIPSTYAYERPEPLPLLISRQAEVTAYSSIDSCHYPNCAMANTERAHIGAIACPTDLPLGTEVLIEDTWYTCKDRTAKRYDGRFDIFTGYREEAHKEALNYGVKTLTVYYQK